MIPICNVLENVDSVLTLAILIESTCRLSYAVLDFDVLVTYKCRWSTAMGLGSASLC